MKSHSGWIQVELPTAEICNYLKIGGTFSNEEPESFVLSASNDGETYVELLNSGILSWTHNEMKEWSIENETAYKFYKIEATNTRANYVGFSEIQLIEHTITKEY